MHTPSLQVSAPCPVVAFCASQGTCQSSVAFPRLRGLCVLCARSSLQSSEMTSSWEGSWAPGSRGRECGLAGEGPGYCLDAAYVPASSQDGTNLKMNTPSLTKPSCAHPDMQTHTHVHTLKCRQHAHTYTCIHAPMHM